MLVDRHEVVREGWFCDESIMNESLACLAENSVMHISLPDIVNLCNRIILKELYICDDVKHS